MALNLPQSAVDALKAASQANNPLNLPSSAVSALKAAGTSGKSTSNAVRAGQQTQNLSGAAGFAPAIVHGISHSLEGLVSLGMRLTGNKKSADKFDLASTKRDEDFGNNFGTGSEQKIGTAIGEMLPYIAGGEALAPLKVAGRSAGGLEKIAQSLGAGKYASKAAKMLGYAIPTAAAGAGVGAASYDPGGDKKGDAEVGAALSLVLPPALQLGIKGAKTILSPKKAIASILAKASPKTADALRKSNPDDLIGESLGIPLVKRLETNTLPTVPGSGYDKKMAQMAAKLETQGNDLYSTLTGNEDSDVAERSIRKDMQGFENALNDVNSKQYKKAQKLAKEKNISFPLREYFSKSKQLLNDYSETARVGGLTDLAAALNALNAIAEKGKSSDGRGTSLKTANLLRSTVGKLQRSTPDRALSSIWSQLHEAVTKDIRNVIDKPGKEDVRDLYDKAQSFYSKYISPLSDKAMQAIRSGKKDLNTVAQTFLPSKKGKTNLLKKFLDYAPKSSKALMTSFLEDAVDTDIDGNRSLNPQKLAGKLNTLGGKRLRMLVTDPDDRAELKKFLNDYEKNKDIFVNFNNFPTGFQRIADENIKGIGSALLGVAKELGTGHPFKAAGHAINASWGIPAGKVLNSKNLVPEVAKAKKLQEEGKPSKELTHLKNVILGYIAQSNGDD